MLCALCYLAKIKMSVMRRYWLGCVAQSFWIVVAVQWTDDSCLANIHAKLLRGKVVIDDSNVLIDSEFYTKIWPTF